MIFLIRRLQQAFHWPQTVHLFKRAVNDVFELTTEVKG